MLEQKIKNLEAGGAVAKSGGKGSTKIADLIKGKGAAKQNRDNALAHLIKGSGAKKNKSSSETTTNDIIKNLHLEKMRLM